MARNLAIKRLTASDLTFFEWQFRYNNAGNQKAINLNADIFVKELYPGFSNFASSTSQKFPIDVFIYGPGLKGELNLQRKIVKSPGSKNWRLNGEFVNNPVDDPTRFNILQSNDFAVFDFSGEVTPTSVSIVFVAATVSEDSQLHTALDLLLATNKMIKLSPSELEVVVNRVSPLPEHPIYGLTLDVDRLSSDLEDVALGGSQSREKLTRPSTRKMSRSDLQKAKENADHIGLRGEQFINNYLFTLMEQGKIRSFEWVSNRNAISPYDFWVSNDGASETLIDVKSTQGEFERTLHISLSELHQMGNSAKYDIYRVFSIAEATAQLRIAENVGSFARQILEVLNGLPSGIFSDSISFAPTILPFGNPITLELPDQAEEEE